jgi:hypothetical protein
MRIGFVLFASALPALPLGLAQPQADDGHVTVLKHNQVERAFAKGSPLIG